MIAASNRQAGSNDRPGFTLVELLVVVSIIVVLAALVASATLQAIVVQQQRTTETTIQKIWNSLDQEWKAVIDQVKLETPPAIVKQNLAGNDDRRAKVIWRKLRLKQEFPMNFSEAVAPAPTFISPRASYADALSGWTPPSPPNNDLESGACLYMALKQNRRGMNFDVDSALSSSELGTVTLNGRQFTTFMDGWGHPMTFYRWPTGNPELNASADVASSPNRDVQDPEGTLTNPTWVSSNPGALQFSHMPNPLCHPLPGPPPTVPGSPSSFRLEPVIASFGAAFGAKKKTSGFQDTFMTPDGSGNDSGNIYSYRLRPGARGD
jgi:prepilin-type N-terminal cleavage/methylation domain-containing protein